VRIYYLTKAVGELKRDYKFSWKMQILQDIKERYKTLTEKDLRSE